MPPRAAPLTDAIVGINVTPFVDVALVLLIMVMVAARAASASQAIPLQLPRGHPPSSPAAPAVVSIDISGQAYLDARPVTDDALLATLRAAPPERLIVISDPRVSHGRVVRVLDLTRAAGVTRFTLQALRANDAAP